MKWLQERVTGRVLVFLDLSNFWNSAFNELGSTHPNVSTGMSAIIIALHRIRPSRLYLAGFDSVLNPAIPYISRVPSPFNEGGTKGTGNDWATENKLLPVLATHYGVTIKDLAGTHKFLGERLQAVRA